VKDIRKSDILETENQADPAKAKTTSSQGLENFFEKEPS